MRAMRGQSPLDSVASILNGLAHRLGLETKLLEFRLRRDWAAIVGEQIAAHTRPEEIRFRKLLVSVHHSVWLQQLTFLKPALLEQINRAAGEQRVTDLVLRLGEVGEPSRPGLAPAQASRLASEPSPQLKAQAEQYAAAVQDLSLREQLAKVMAESLSRSASTPGHPEIL